jgi:hypothetical protein
MAEKDTVEGEGKEEYKKREDQHSISLLMLYTT